MPTWPKLIATIAIWMAFSIVGTSNTVANSGNVTLTIAVIAVAALISTLAVWVGGSPSSSESPKHTAAARRREKLKHADRSRMTRLADVLDEDEAAALYEELQARLSVHSDGEVVSLDALLAEREEQNRRANP